MNLENMDKNNMIPELEHIFSLLKSISSPDFSNLNINSYQYFRDILFVLIENNEKYSIAFGDINKMSIINEEFGKEER